MDTESVCFLGGCAMTAESKYDGEPITCCMCCEGGGGPAKHGALKGVFQLFLRERLHHESGIKIRRGTNHVVEMFTTGE